MAQPRSQEAIGYLVTLWVTCCSSSKRHTFTANLAVFHLTDKIVSLATYGAAQMIGVSCGYIQLRQSLVQFLVRWMLMMSQASKYHLQVNSTMGRPDLGWIWPSLMAGWRSGLDELDDIRADGGREKVKSDSVYTNKANLYTNHDCALGDRTYGIWKTVHHVGKAKATRRKPFYGFWSANDLHCHTQPGEWSGKPFYTVSISPIVFFSRLSCLLSYQPTYFSPS